MDRRNTNNRGISTQPVAIRSQRTTRLLTNSYKLQTASAIEVLMYDIQIHPQLENDNMMMKKKLIKTLRRELELRLGRFIHAGGSLFALRGSQTSEESSSFQLSTSASGVDYTVEITLTKALNVNQQQNMSTDELTFLNILLRDLLKRCKLKQIGTNRNHFDMTQGIVLQIVTASVIPGFFTSIQAVSYTHLTLPTNREV